MKKVLIAPNSFKSSIDAVEASSIIEKTLNEVGRFITIKAPIADGGDGTLEVIAQNLETERHNLKVTGPTGAQISSFWLKYGDTAFVEAAKANGLTLLESSQPDIFNATSFGVGEMINDAIKCGCIKIAVFLGGSATNDGGFNALRALGFRFLDFSNNEITKLKDLINLNWIDTVKVNFDTNKTKIFAATDVTNTLTGLNGASYVYARQKGARDEDLPVLDNLLSHFASITEKYTHKDIKNSPGTGAAGGLAFGLSAYLDAKIVGGFDYLSDIISLEDKVRNCDIVITGEGKLDSQTLCGKAPFKVSQMAKKYQKPCYIITGSLDSYSNFSDYFDKIAVLKQEGMTIEYSIANVRDLLQNSVKTLFDNKKTSI